jgi:hypothetical protein
MKQPLGMSLPGKSRSWLKGAESIFCNMLEAGDRVHVTYESVLETVSLTVGNNEDLGTLTAILRESVLVSSCKKTDETKCIQTKLISSFHLKSRYDTNVLFLFFWLY